MPGVRIEFKASPSPAYVALYTHNKFKAERDGGVMKGVFKDRGLQLRALIPLVINGKIAEIDSSVLKARIRAIKITHAEEADCGPFDRQQKIILNAVVFDANHDVIETRLIPRDMIL